MDRITYSASRYEITRYEVAVVIDGETHTLGCVYPKSRSAMLRLIDKLHRSPVMHERLVSLGSRLSDDGKWNGKVQRYVSRNGYLGFTGRTERDCDLALA